MMCFSDGAVMTGQGVLTTKYSKGHEKFARGVIEHKDKVRWFRDGPLPAQG